MKVFPFKRHNIEKLMKKELLFASKYIAPFYTLT